MPCNGLGIGGLPLTIDFLQEGVLIRFLASQKSKQADRAVVGSFVSADVRSSLRDSAFVPRRVSQPTVFSTLTNAPIAVANNVWTTSLFSNLSDRKLLENGLTRFALTGSFWRIWLEWNRDADEAWISQASSIFHARGIDLEEDLGVYELVYPRTNLFGDFLGPSKAQLERRSQQPIYLFIHPPPYDLHDCKTPSLHHWSFHEDGRSPLSRKTCHSLGLPIQLKLEYLHSYSWFWPKDTYRQMHQYQLLRSFDPSTIDFARHVGYDEHIFRPVNNSDRFEIQKESPPESRASTPTSDMSGIEDLGPICSSSVFAASEIQEGFPSFGLPFFFESSTELVTTTESFDMEVD
ncbi:hypothetical protein PM082_007562 [Marasmius tenuissimus]|nr:hypothetical protein PM082_007562 [Marasmius tenuissimus]